jgi:hypothetical protein
MKKKILERYKVTGMGSVFDSVMGVVVNIGHI